MKIKQSIYAALMTLIGLLFAGCNDELDERTTLHFIGDSLVARWDLQGSFSSLATYNHGLSGSGISYIERLAGSMSGKNVVVITGTNDNRMMTDDIQRREYASRYIAAIEALGAAHIYLYEVLPRDFDGDRADINNDISAFNSEIRDMLRGSDHITYLTAYDDFIGNDGKIIVEYYSDRLHLSPQGYERLSQKLFDNL